VVGTLSTAGGLVFFGEMGGVFTAVDAGRSAGLALETGQAWRASPMTYMVNGKQYVELAAPAVYSLSLWFSNARVPSASTQGARPASAVDECRYDT
jgi:hypothetical protein